MNVMRQGSNFGKGQRVAADYAMNPSITFTSRDSGGIGAAVGVRGSTPASRELGKEASARKRAR